MKTLILFDSYFGNTEQIAREIAKAFEPETTAIKRIADAVAGDFMGVDLLILGSPTRGFRPSEGMMAFFKTTLPQNLTGTKAAVFDTRIDLETIKSKVFRFVVNTGGYAAHAMGRQMKSRKASLVVPPEGFFVSDQEGPLKEGEEQRAQAWGKTIKGEIG